MDKSIQKMHFLNTIMPKTYKLYFDHGARSSKKVDYFHGEMKNAIETYIQKLNNKNDYKVELECDISSSNSSGKKKCDIVIFKKGINKYEPYIVFPVKIIMTNYKQNKNNNWESLTGELCHLKWENENINLIPINILINKTPYLKKNGTITKFENVTFDDIKNYKYLQEKNICHDVINYIINVEHKNSVGVKYNTLPIFKEFNQNTEYRTFDTILNELF